MTPRLRATALVAVLLVLGSLSGCVSLPRAGAVHTAPQSSRVDDDGALDYTPGGPKPGATPGNIVENFLVAMTATPVNTSVARQYLTDAGSRTWVPERGTLVYGSKDVQVSGAHALVRLGDTVRLDGRGHWLGDTSGGTGSTLDLHMVKEAGQWRITDPPDALVIPRTHFESTFTQYNLYFFDKTSQVLVPEPVYVPRGAQAPTVLVSGLLAGPSRDLLGVERSYLPARTTLDDLSVPVARDGTAVVPVTDQVLDLDDDRLSLAFAQLAWTLGQIPGIERMRVTVDGSPLDLPGEGSDVAVGSWTEFDPAVAWASQTLFGLREGRVVSESGGHESPTSGAFGALALGVTTFAVDLQAEHVAAVTDGGARVRVATRDSTGSEPPTAASATSVYAGTDVLRPVYDVSGQLWLLDRTRSGARVVVVGRAGARALTVPGVTGQSVSAFTVSRDGTRLVAALRGTTTDRLVLARVQRQGDGAVRRVGAAHTLPLADAPARVTDLAWRTAGSLAALTEPAADVAQVVVAPVDGSADTGDLAGDAQPFREHASGLVTAPTLGSPLYLATDAGRVYTLTTSGRWATAGIDDGLFTPTFPG